MPNRLPTVWDIEPHTIAKHQILKRYFDAWLPILTTWTRVIFIDGFAGPGVYRGGEPGSPIIVLRAACDRQPPVAGDVTFVFVEKDDSRYQVLLQELDKMTPSLPTRFTVVPIPGKFDQLESELDRIHGEGKVLVPALAFIDPFGITGFPMRLVAKVLKNPHTEVMVTFMVETLDRFAEKVLPKQATELYGDESWRSCVGLLNQRDRQLCLVKRYRGRLKEAGAKFTLAFEMADQEDRTIYFLVYATTHELGMQKMKDAMAGVDPTMNYRFSDLVPQEQRRLFDFGDAGSWAPLAADVVWRHFTGQAVRVEEVKRFVIRDENHVFPWRVAILRELYNRNPPAVRYVDRPNRKGSFLEHLLIQFATFPGSRSG